MKTNFKFYAVKTALLLAVLSISSCGKLFEGPAGPAGAKGADGADGNANVIASSEFVPTWSSGTATWSSNVTAPMITQDIVDYGVVMAYVKSGTRWTALPSTGFFYFDDVLTYTFDVNKITLFYYNTSGTLPNSPAGNTFRIVAISASNLAKYPDTDWRDYNQACKVLNLTDNK